ncbi:MAG: TetR/AcrR family transcriptional regulator [Firmicutes bacterium]|nr:TetR/AcrR family transcriptional regulator [Bacillota bacterium]MBQ3122567.1 TetR/AcrR family transcriptional regulator [Bacillota bacterium]
MDKKENKRNIILDVAFNLFMKKGYAKVKVIDIAENAGIGKGTVYEYFKSKDDILMELVIKYVKKEFVEIGNKTSELGSFREKLIALIEFEFDFLMRYGPHLPEFKQYIFDKDMGFSKELIEAISDIVRIEYTNLSNIIKWGIESGEVRANVDIPMAVHHISTTITSFIMLSSIDPSCEEVALLYTGADKGYLRKYTSEEVYDIIMNGLHS